MEGKGEEEEAGALNLLSRKKGGARWGRVKAPLFSFSTDFFSPKDFHLPMRLCKKRVLKKELIPEEVGKIQTFTLLVPPAPRD